MQHTTKTPKKVWIGTLLLVFSSSAFCTLMTRNPINPWWMLFAPLYIGIGYAGFLLMKKGFEQ